VRAPDLIRGSAILRFQRQRAVDLAIPASRGRDSPRQSKDFSDRRTVARAALMSAIKHGGIAAIA
jgi:hypothetical protein